MKMKKACDAALLTERAVRLYLKKGLVAPGQADGYLDFSEADIQQLQDVALFRQLDFSLEQIAAMHHDPASIPAILRQRISHAQSLSTREQEVHDLLRRLELPQFADFHAAAAQLRKLSLPPLLPRFGQFDEIDDDVRAQETRAAKEALDALDRKRMLRRGFLTALCIIAALSILFAVFLFHTRISGFISPGALSVDTVQGSSATVTFHSPQTIDIIGQETVTLPYHIFNVPLEEGSLIKRGCQLAVELTNLDLLRLGISPLQTFRTGSIALNDQWMKLILHALFEQNPSDHAALWINDICNLRPLFSWKP